MSAADRQGPRPEGRGPRPEGGVPVAPGTLRDAFGIERCEYCRGDVLFCSVPAFLADLTEPVEDRNTIRSMWLGPHGGVLPAVVMWCPNCDVIGVITNGGPNA